MKSVIDYLLVTGGTGIAARRSVLICRQRYQPEAGIAKAGAMPPISPRAIESCRVSNHLPHFAGLLMMTEMLKRPVAVRSTASDRWMFAIASRRPRISRAHELIAHRESRHSAEVDEVGSDRWQCRVITTGRNSESAQRNMSGR